MKKTVLLLLALGLVLTAMAQPAASLCLHNSPYQQTCYGTCSDNASGTYFACMGGGQHSHQYCEQERSDYYGDCTAGCDTWFCGPPPI